MIAEAEIIFTPLNKGNGDLSKCSFHIQYLLLQSPVRLGTFISAKGRHRASSVFVTEQRNWIGALPAFFSSDTIWKCAVAEIKENHEAILSPLSKWGGMSVTQSRFWGYFCGWIVLPIVPFFSHFGTGFALLFSVVVALLWQLWCHPPASQQRQPTQVNRLWDSTPPTRMCKETLVMQISAGGCL